MQLIESKLSELIVCFSVFMLYVAWKKEDYLENSHVLSCFVQLRRILFNLSVFLFVVHTFLTVFYKQ